MQEATLMEVQEPRTKLDYFQTMIGLIRSPRTFFSELSEPDWRSAAKICGISAVFHVAVSYTYVYGRSIPLALILLCNAMLMPLITASLAHMFMTMFWGKKVSLQRMYTVMALASAPVLLFSWLPALGLVTEPWRILLIGFGLNKGCSIPWKRVCLLLFLTLGALVLLIWSALPLISDLKQILAAG